MRNDEDYVKVEVMTISFFDKYIRYVGFIPSSEMGLKDFEMVHLAYNILYSVYKSQKLLSLFLNSLILSFYFTLN